MVEQFACQASDLQPGAALRADLADKDGKEISVALVRSSDGDVYAMSDICSHGEVSLSEGEVDGCEIECWAHGGRFDFRSGAVTTLPPVDPLPTYPVRIDGDRILVDVDNATILEETA